MSLNNYYYLKGGTTDDVNSIENPDNVNSIENPDTSNEIKGFVNTAMLYTGAIVIGIILFNVIIIYLIYLVFKAIFGSKDEDKDKNTPIKN